MGSLTPLDSSRWTTLFGKDAEYLVVLTDGEIKTLSEHGVEVSRGPQLLPRGRRDDVGTLGGTDLTTGFVSGYLDALEIDAEVSAIAAAYPTWCSVFTLPHATVGYDGAHGPAVGSANVRALRITANPALRSKPGFLLVAGTHAREWMNPLIALEFAQQLLANVDPTSTEPATVAATRIVTDGDVIIVPVLNPDGLNYSIHDQAGWRKNRRPNAGSPSCPGVDDNRNFGIYFGGAGSASDPCSGAFRGPHAFSEAETQNVRWLLEEFPNILVAVDSHSFGNKVFRPQPTGGGFIPSLPVSESDHALYTQLETVFTDAVAAVNGTAYSTGTTSNHAGTSDEYMFFGHRVFAFNTECGLSFQPPWSEAAPIIQEVVAGFRALADATLDLTTTTTIPQAAVQCLDRTGSMVTFGYDASARVNAKRFLDMMSLGDWAGIVTFADPSPDPTGTPPADQSRVEFPLTQLDDPGAVSAALAAVDGIDFGGWTPMGAGLERAGSLLAAAPAPRGVLLLSDGHENRSPTVASVLATWPNDLPVFTIALGPASDAGLLSSIAAQTGGEFQLSPDALDLHLIYNQMRADLSDADTILNVSVDGGQNEEARFPIDVEESADRLELAVSSNHRLPGRVILTAPSGREATPDDFGVAAVFREGHAVVSVERPEPGQWHATVAGVRAPYVVAAFLHSPLRLKFRFSPLSSPGETVVKATATFDGRPLSPPRLRVRSHQIAKRHHNRRVLPGKPDGRIEKRRRRKELCRHGRTPDHGSTGAKIRLFCRADFPEYWWKRPASFPAARRTVASDGAR